MAVLGLSDPDDGDWARLRGLQYSSLRSGTFSRIATQVAAMLAIVTLTMEQVPVVFMAGWITVVALTLWYGQRIDRSLADADRRRMSRGEVQAQMVASIFSGLVWAVPLGCFGPAGRCLHVRQTLHDQTGANMYVRTKFYDRASC